MRLLWARVGVPYSPATGLPIAAQTVSQMVDRMMALPEGTRLYLLAPVVRGRKGEYRRELAEWQKAGFTRVRIDGAVLRDRGRAGARQEIQARHRGRGRPAGGAAGDRDAAGGQLRDGAEAGRRAGFLDRAILSPSARELGRGSRRAHRLRRSRQPLSLRSPLKGRGIRHASEARAAFVVPSEARGSGRARRARRQRPAGPHRLLREIRLPGLRLHHRRDRAAPVLVQRPAGRLPGLRRARREAAVRCRAGRPQRGAVDQEGRDRAVGAVQPAQPLLHAGARQPRRRIRVQPRHAVARPARGHSRRHPQRHRRPAGDAALRRRAQELRGRARRSTA